MTSIAGRSFHRVSITRWAALSASGNAQALWQATQSGTHALRLWQERWVGMIGASPWQRDMVELLAPLAAQCLPLHDPCPSLVLGLSKGDPAAWMSALGGQRTQLHHSNSSHLAARLAQRLGLPLWQGPAVVAACSTGLMALLSAAERIEDQWCADGLALAADAPLHPFLLAAYAALGVRAQQLPSAFQGQDTGFAPAEGAAAIALGQHGPWRLVHGVRLGDASHETRCNDLQVLQACLDALWQALPQPDLIVCHGTGTAAGDAFELKGLNGGPWRSAPRLVCKPIIGHCLGASGLVELCAGLESPSERLWKLSLGFGGHIVAVALERTGSTHSARSCAGNSRSK